MNEKFRKNLCALVKNFGKIIYRNEKKIEGLLKFYCGPFKDEISLVMAAVKSGIASEIIKHNDDGTLGELLPEFIKTLGEGYSIDEPSVRLIVEAISNSLSAGEREDPFKKKRESARIDEPQAEVIAPVKPSGMDISIAIDGEKLEMVFIPAGSFTMGDPFACGFKHANEGPAHGVTLTKGFYLGRFAVTQALWVKITGENPSHFKKGGNFPVEKISWNDCMEFIKNINSKKFINGEFRLPTEAEWEYACRAGSQKAYYWGDKISGAYCWYNDNSDNSTHPAGVKKPNAFGLYDMSGNVWEWCGDWYGIYHKAELTDPKGPEKGEFRIARGGAWSVGGGRCTSASRERYIPAARYGRLGFRLCLDLSQ